MNCRRLEDAKHDFLSGLLLLGAAAAWAGFFVGGEWIVTKWPWLANIAAYGVLIFLGVLLLVFACLVLWAFRFIPMWIYCTLFRRDE